jgi:hypothetical protein
MSVIGPSVWTGRALQAENDDLEKVGLALLYPPSHEGACVKLLHSELPSYLSNCSSVVSIDQGGARRPCDQGLQLPSGIGDIRVDVSLPLHRACG